MITKIALTGGPSAGKTSLVSRAINELGDRGIRVFVVPEAATLAIANMNIKPFGDCLDMDQFQEVVLNLQIHLEDMAELAAIRHGGDTVILCDRGLLDNLAYASEETIRHYLKQVSKDPFPIAWAMNRYNAVIHMVTAADGAADAYTLANNVARTETPEQAIEKDKACVKAWSGHNHVRYIDNSTDFEGKLNRAMAAIYDTMGIPVPVEKERKYLFKKMKVEDIPAAYAPNIVTIIQHYLTSKDNTERRIRQRTCRGDVSCFYTEKTEISSVARSENERLIGFEEYLLLQNEIDTSLAPVKKTRVCFRSNNQYFELDMYDGDDEHMMLEIELVNEDDKVIIPEFMSPYFVKEVTDDPNYRNSAIAKRVSKDGPYLFV